VGYGSDGTLWGGEALAGRPGHWTRKASFRPFKLTGGDQAGRQPWRSAAALLWELGLDGGHHAGDDVVHWPGGDASQTNLDPAILQLTRRAWQKSINTHTSSAVGRLFDAAASLVLGRHLASFEGQGPMELEQIAGSDFNPVSLPLILDDAGILRSDWAPLLPVLQNQSVSARDRAALFHATMARALVDQAIEIRKTHTFDAVGLSGGVFQNRVLTERVVELLAEKGIEVRLHTEIPANDGGLSFGQVIEALNL
jgi:hydrogenase maturation protein HypF